jgi:hypothetical protein
LAALSKALGFEEAFLVELAATANDRYRLAKPIKKPDGSIRQPFDALEPLKEVHRRLKKEVFSKVVFPKYLTGSLKGRDYRVNASLHTGAKIVICEDIEGFFPSTNSSLVMDIWQNFFGFSPEVSELLTKLTTKDGLLPQGAITSSFLANLAFWRAEPLLYNQLLEQGIVYSRYVDDITISSKHRIENDDKTRVIAVIYGMLRKSGYSAKRRKHEIATSGHRMLTTKLLINKKPALKPEERANIRTAVFQLEQKISQGIKGPDITRELNRVAGLVGKLSRFHSTQGNGLKQRILKIRKLLNIINPT